MSSSPEKSPDWVHSFKAWSPTILSLSSGSESSLDDDPVSDDEDEDEDEVSLSKLFKKDQTRKNSKVKLQNEKDDVEQITIEKQADPTRKNVDKGKAPNKSKPRELNNSVWTLSSDSECSADDNLATEHYQKGLGEYDAVHRAEEGDSKVAVLEENEKPPHDMASALKSPKKKLKKDNKLKKENEENPVFFEEKEDEMNIREEDTTDNKRKPVSSSRLPLVLPEKVQRTKALVECEGDSIDLSGDVGAVGRLMMSDNNSGDHDIFLDLKGTIYKTTIVPSQTFCVVSFGQSEAKIEAIINDFIQLKPQSNVYEAETTVEGILEGFSFDSEEEPDHPRTATGQNGKDEPDEEQPKPKGKPIRKADKTKGATGKKTNAAGGNPPKKAKKIHVPKKSKTKK